MPDRETIAVYDAKVGDYVALTEQLSPGKALRAFMSRVRKGGTVLDIGCGPGSASAMMVQQGLLVDPIDASAEMVRVASEQFCLPARQATFDDISAEAIYDGAWANFSLLHAPRSRFGDHLSAIFTALRPNSPFHIGLKLGAGELRDDLGRLYTFFAEEELTDALEIAGFQIDEKRFGEEVGLAGTCDPWISILAMRP